MEIAVSLSTREKILEAARFVFIERGREGARMQEIADRAGVNKAMLFYYFSSKDLLYREVLDSIFRPLFEAVNGIIDGRHDAEQSGAPMEIQSGLSDVFGAATDKVREVLGAMTIGKFVEEYCRSSASANA